VLGNVVGKIGGVQVKKYLEIIVSFLVLVCFSFFMAFALLNWALGCGESFPQADGSRVEGECVGPIEIFDL
jgi:hypothetical protein